jgi:pilus assembly protein CpaB
MNRRSLITLAVAVAIGLVAMRMSQQLLSAGARKEQETQEVLSAARDLKEEEILKPDMVKVVKMVRSAVPANAFKSFKDIEGRWVKTQLLEGDILIDKKLGPKGTPPGLVSNIPKGMRAMAIDVTEQSGVSGFILPGHHVDVIHYQHSEKKDDLHGETILQNVLVLAAGQLFTRPEERTVQSRTVTLALNPSDVDILVAARSRGTLSLSLRGVNDHDVVTKVAPKPEVDPAQEKRWQLAEEKRMSLEKELMQLKEQLAKRAAAPPPPKAQPVVRIATIYRGLHNVQRVRMDSPGVAELESSAPIALADPPTRRAPTGFRTSTLAEDDDADEETEP